MSQFNALGGLQSRGEIADGIAAYVQNTTANARTIILNAMDQGFRIATSRTNWPQLLVNDSSLLSIASGATEFRTPSHVRNIVALIDTTSPFVLRSADAYTMYKRLRGFSNLRGEPGEFAFTGQVANDVAIGSDDSPNLRVVSSDASDTTRTFIVEGIDENGDLVRETGTLNGTTNVGLTAQFQDPIHQFTVSEPRSGARVTLNRSGAATIFSCIGPNATSAVYNRYTMNSAASQALTMRVVYELAPTAKLNESDQYILPIEEYVFYFAAARYYKHQRQGDLAGQELQLAEAALQNVIAKVESSEARFAMPENPRRRPLGVVVENAS